MPQAISPAQIATVAKQKRLYVSKDAREPQGKIKRIGPCPPVKDLPAPHADEERIRQWLAALRD